MSRIQIYDTTLRDGSQAEGISFSLQDKLAITQRLDRLGFDYVEGGYPASNEKDAQYFQRVCELPLKHVRVCAFGMTRRKGVKAAEDDGLRALLESRAKTITIVGKSSLFQVTEVLRTNADENLAMIRDSIAYLAANGREVIFDAEHFFDGWKADAGYSLAALQAAAEAGAGMVVLCDTNGGTMPEDIARAVRSVVESVSVPVGIHCHNDCELAVANSLAAVDAGAVQVQGTINGFGERCGNVDLISVIANLALKKGYEVLVPGGVEHLTELSRFVYEILNMNFRPHQPFVGKSAFAHKGGMHVSGIARNTAAYEHIEPEAVGNERRVLVSELSGRSNLVAMTERHKIPNDSKLMDTILVAGRVVGKCRLPVRGGRRFVRPAGPQVPGHVPPAFRAAQLSRQRGDERLGRDPHRGDGEDPHRRRGAARGGRGRRPGERPGRRHAEGPQRPLPRLAEAAPRGLQGPRDQLRGRHRRRRPRGDREPGRDRRLGHRRRERERDRGKLDRTGG